MDTGADALHEAAPAGESRENGGAVHTAVPAAPEPHEAADLAAAARENGDALPAAVAHEAETDMLCKPEAAWPQVAEYEHAPGAW